MYGNNSPSHIFGLWTGVNPMPDSRKRCFESFAITELEPVLVTTRNLSEWILPTHPLHEAYEYLSAMHRADYLRGYLMLHYGGGYADIKWQTGTWLPAVSRVNRSKGLIAAGYREIRGGTPWLQRHEVEGKHYVLKWPVSERVAAVATNLMRAARPFLIGNGAYYFKPRTLFARLWVREVERRLDVLLPNLRDHPAKSLRDCAGSGSGYPIPWSFLLADVFHPMSTVFFPLFARALPTPSFENYL